MNLFLYLFDWSFTLYSKIFHTDNDIQLYAGRNPGSVWGKPVAIYRLLADLATYGKPA